jgi:hypothetical protein
MHRLTRRGIRLAVMTLGFAGLLVAVNAVPGGATPSSSGFVSTPLAHGKLLHGSLQVKAGLQIVVQRNDIAAGASSGWHSHPGGAIIVIQSGQLTTYRAVRNTDDEEEGRKGAKYHCVITNYTAGQAFVEIANEVLNARNNGSTPTVSFATFPGVPVDSTGKTLQRTDRPDPGVCASAPA